MRDAVIELAREANVVREHADVALAADLLQGEPDFEGAKAAGVLRAEIKVVDRLVAEGVVGRMISKCRAQFFQ